MSGRSGSQTCSLSSEGNSLRGLTGCPVLGPISLLDLALYKSGPLGSPGLFPRQNVYSSPIRIRRLTILYEIEIQNENGNATISFVFSYKWSFMACCFSSNSQYNVNRDSSHLPGHLTICHSYGCHLFKSHLYFGFYISATSLHVKLTMCHFR